MKQLLYVWLFLMTILIPTTWAGEKTTLLSLHSASPMSVDSVLDKVIQFAPLYETLIEDYRADVYMKGNVYIRKKNTLIRYAPSMFKLKRGVREYMTESYSELHYTAPNIYDQKIKARYGTIQNFEGIGVDVLDYFRVNIYSTSLLTSKLLSPLSPNAHKYYKFSIDSLQSGKNERLYRISFTPRNKSYQLVKGHMLISPDVWSVRELQFSGRSEYLHFDNLIKMGDVGEENELLPITYDLNATFRLFGNVVDGSFSVNFDYNSILVKDRYLSEKKREIKYDLTESFTLQCDTAACLQVDSVSFDSLRLTPLAEYEKDFYRKAYSVVDTTSLQSVAQAPTHLFWAGVEDVGDALISRHTFNFAQGGRLRFSPIINPFLISYSGKDGLSYRHDIRYNRMFKGDRLLKVSPKLGYNFKYNEFYWRLSGDFDYWPSKRASLHLKTGNGNRIYSSEILDDLKQMPDSILDFDQIKFSYFRNLYVELFHRVEVFNGFSIDVGVSMHRRSAIDKVGLPDAEELEPDYEEKIKKHYRSFAPRLGVSWTPGQYYYMNGKRKINLYSKWPTFSVDWERGVQKIFGASMEYERCEVDVQQKITLGLMRNLYYRVGAGAFTDQEQLYFVDFINFSKSNLPVGWSDEIGGVFQLLDRRWYNSSRKYLRMNSTYEAPFLVLPRLQKYTRNVLNERLYLGVLMMPHLNPYVELGYGIGTHIFDFGVFVSSINGSYSDFGIKFTLELFNR